MQTDELKNNPTSTSESTTTKTIEPKGPPKACLFVASLDEYTTESDLETLFGKFGEILKIKLLKDHVSRPYAFVQFASADDATDAIENTKGLTVNDRRLRVERARVNRTLFIAKISRQMQDDQLKEIAEEYGEVESVTIIKNHQTNRSKGCGFVKYSFREDAALALTELKEKQRKWVVEWATSNNDPESLRIDKNNIFVGSLNPQEITQDLLTEHFEVYGEIESATLINREENNDSSFRNTSPSPNGVSDESNSTRPRNAFAFIRYKTPEHSAAAIESENGKDWLGNRIRVQYCESKEMKNKRRAKHTKYAPYNHAPYYPGMPMMYMGDGHDMNMYNSYYPVYYNSPPWMYQPGMEGAPPQQMMPNAPMFGEDMNSNFSHLNMGPSVVPVLPWLP